MRELKKEEMKDIIDVILSTSLKNVKPGKAELFFPLEEAALETETEHGMILLEKTDRVGRNTMIKPGVLIKQHGRVSLAYVSMTYVLDFNLPSFFRIEKQ